MIFYVFVESGKQHLDCACVVGLGFEPLVFTRWAYICAVCFFDVCCRASSSPKGLCGSALGSLSDGRLQEGLALVGRCRLLGELAPFGQLRACSFRGLLMEGYVVFRRLVLASSGTLIMVHELYGTGT